MWILRMGEISFSISMSFYLLASCVIKSNSGTTMWRFNVEDGKVVDASNFQKVNFPSTQEEDPIFQIISSSMYHEKPWVKKKQDEFYCIGRFSSTNSSKVIELPAVVKFVKSHPDDDEELDCGKPVNFTYYDNLVGVANRLNHPNVPESQIALIFKKKGTELDIDALERKLKRAKREKPKSVQMYNQIGNFFRIKGNTYKSIECFRRALAVSPHNAEVLLNLARVLYNVQYLDDAIYLTRRSLEVQPPDRSAWQQYFTLGEIFKAYGHYQEASLHMRHCLQLRPGFDPALAALKDMEAIPGNAIHVYTLLIIICLVLGVLLVVMSSAEGGSESDSTKNQRQTNKTSAKPPKPKEPPQRQFRSRRNPRTAYYADYAQYLNTDYTYSQCSGYATYNGEPMNDHPVPYYIVQPTVPYF